jgi:hypothetical protein
MATENGKRALHALLAVESDLKGEFDKIVVEAKKTFKDKQKHFESWHRTLKMKDQTREQEEAAGEEYQAMVTTVPAKLEYTGKAFAKYMDALFQKEMTNQTANADLVVDGDVIAQQVPATCLLALENKLKMYRSMVELIPTWAPGIEWVPDSAQGEGVFRAKHPETALKTEQILKPFTLYEATPEHPAQVDKLTEQVSVGLFTRQKWTGTISPAQKSRLLGTIDNVIRSVKQARMKANETEIISGQIGEKLFDKIINAVK